MSNLSKVPTIEGVRELWVRAVALAVNRILGGYIYPEYDADPSSAGLRPGFTYWNTTLNRPRSWDGAAFVSHW